MVKGVSEGRKTGIQRGVQRHKIKSVITPEHELRRNQGTGAIAEEIQEHAEGQQDLLKIDDGTEKRKKELLQTEIARIHDHQPTLLGVPHSAYFEVGRKCFAACSRTCQKLRLVGFKQLANNNGEYVLLGRQDNLIHLTLLTIGIAAIGHKMWATVVITATQGLGLQSCMCICGTLYFFNSFCISLGVVAKPGESADVLNSWRHVGHLTGDDKLLGKSIPLKDISTVLKLITVILLYQGVALALPMASVAGPFTMMPVFLYPTIESFGLIPVAWPVPPLIWQLLLFPLEYAIFLQTALAGSLCGSIFIVSLGIQKSCTDQLGKMSIDDPEKRKKAERLYICLTLFNRVFRMWCRFMIVPALIGLTLCIIYTLYLTIRYTELPLLLYVWCPTTGVTLLLVIFWVSYDVVLVKRTAEGIISRFSSHDGAPHMRWMTREERVALVKRATAMKVLEFPIGDFADFSLNLPVLVWEEVMNQVLFMLTL